MDKKYYLAYGSNLSVKQMAERCPDAVYVGTATIPDYQLLFKGSLTGSYLTIEPKEGSEVPVLVWQISEMDEHRLDRYEGFPTFYYKKKMKLPVRSLFDRADMGEVEAIIYIMHEERRKGCPGTHYYEVCLEGYQRFGFDTAILEQALIDSIGKTKTKAILKEIQFHE
uniref:gamma-glutamylcyclotransferase family protein n=1 Tax=Agathobacter sp. TaxID=2021311 RepID=UPI004056E127